MKKDLVFLGTLIMVLCLAKSSLSFADEPNPELVNEVNIQALTLLKEKRITLNEFKALLQPQASVLTQSSYPDVMTKGSYPSVMNKGSYPDVMTKGSYPSVVTKGSYIPLGWQEADDENIPSPEVMTN